MNGIEAKQKNTAYDPSSTWPLSYIKTASSQVIFRTLFHVMAIDLWDLTVPMHYLFTSPAHSFSLTLIHHSMFFLVLLGFPLGFRLPLFYCSTFSLSLTFTNSHFATSSELHSDLQLDSKIPLWFLLIILLLCVSFKILLATPITEPTNSHIMQSFNIRSTHLHSYGINLCIYKYE